MDTIYCIALEQAIGTNKSREIIETYRNILKVVVAVFELVTPDMIDRLFMVVDSVKIIDDLRSVLKCGGTTDVIRFLHPTFREFLLNRETCGQYYVDINAAHEFIAQGCLSVLGKELTYDTCKLYDHKPKRSFRPQELKEKCIALSSALHHSCSFWASHVIPQSGVVSPTLVSMIEDFFTSKLLDWIYMIAVQGSIDKAVTMLRKLISLESNERIRQWSRDASRFLKLHWNTIREDPLKVYYEFAFAP
ncbi:hypothetical protein CPB86DRAFT_820589 [Serendipita vermifera]|nr:hypothetical protein CPB86DRAFT_820589 [Serendipita vermifera]